MKGYKTWLAVIGFTLLGFYEIINGNLQKGFEYLMIALSLLGIGHKLEKTRNF